jgi:hypothetical protein
MAVVACTPHPGLGSVAIQHPALVQVVDLATCRTTTKRLAKASGGPRVVVHRNGKTGSQSIVFHGRTVYTVRESYRTMPAGTPGPLEVFGTTAHGTWILFGIDPMGSESLVADGWKVQAVPIRGGPVKTVAVGLASPDYRAWCGGRLVLVAGGDRIATHNKWLIVTGPRDWKARVIVKDPHRAFGSLACAPDGKSIVVQSSPDTGVNYNVHARWSLWRVRFDGSMTRLTGGASDYSPQIARDGTVYFVRSGSLYALRGGKLLGPLLALGRRDGYYGHVSWPYSVRR